MDPNTFKSEFLITIQFDKNSENPSRVFQAMSDIIKSFQELDHDLIGSIDSKIEPVLLLEDIEIGSLKAWLKSILRGLPDEAIKDGDIKKLIGHYLLKGKYILLNKLEDKLEINDRSIIEDIQYELVEEAKETGIRSFPDYAPLSPKTIIKNIDNITKALEPLSSTDQASLSTPFGESKFNLTLKIDPQSMEDLITAERIDNESTMVLKVKKPDYLGQSMWEFKHGAKTLHASISDEQWLKDFQDRKYDIRPGDSIRARVKTTLKYGHDLSLVSTTYEITAVQNIVRYLPGRQSSMHDDEQ